MAWEMRNGRKYYYTSQREGDKIRKIYVGTGVVGRTAELALENRREQRQRVRNWLENAATKFAELDAIDGELTVGLAAILYAEHGIRLDARAARRALRKQEAPITDRSVREARLSPEDRETWQRLREQASRGDREAASALLPILASHPELRDRLGDLSRLTVNRWLDLMAGPNGTNEKKALQAKVEQRARSLHWNSTDSLEELLAWRVSRLWLQGRYFDLQVEAAQRRTAKEHEFLAKHQHATEQAYTTALQTLQEYQTRGNPLQGPVKRKPSPR